MSEERGTVQVRVKCVTRDDDPDQGLNPEPLDPEANAPPGCTNNTVKHFETLIMRKDVRWCFQKQLNPGM